MSSPPRATYRLQLRAGMDFAHAAGLVPYLASLGISHLYLSPPFAASPGSTHGYDIVDPNRFDDELGGEEGFVHLRRALDEYGLGLILDIVPNHMGIGRSNAWWWDVLCHGQSSPYAHFFDIDFAADLDGKLVLPILAAPLEEVLARGDLQVVQDGAEHLLAYGDERFPLSAGCTDPQDLPRTLDEQSYRLIEWRKGTLARNYRRFFNIDRLAGLRVEDPEVFEASHELILDLARRQLIQGLRIDHVDGLTDPKAYLDRLQERLTDVRTNTSPFYVVVEKILIGEEQLPRDWPVSGTTGYEFAGSVLGVLISRAGLDRLAELAGRFTGLSQDYGAIVRAAKQEVLDGLFAGEFAALVSKMSEVAAMDEALAGVALRRLLTAFPVYRTYAAGDRWSAADLGVLEQAFDRAGEEAEPDVRLALDRLERLFARGRTDQTAKILQAFQQLSAPLMAKSVEDTAFYRYHRLLALNEVGGEPDSVGCRPEEFHRHAAARLQHCPDTMLCTATHDTKRGEDARARLAVLSEVPEDWETAAWRWREMNAHLSPVHPADEYAFYQSLVGAWPVNLRPNDRIGTHQLRDRLVTWLLKALREGKERSDWNDPDIAYEECAVAFVHGSMECGGEFLKSVADFTRWINPAAQANTLGQLLLKLTSPGVPDIYQGTEFLELSLVDPDNRRSVDFAARMRALAEPEEHLESNKLEILRAALALRGRQPYLFARGRYHPLAIEGAKSSNVLAYGRVDGERVAITVVTRLLGSELVRAGASVLEAAAWGDTMIVLPRDWHRLPWHDHLNQAAVEIVDGRLMVSQLLHRTPVAVVATV